MWLLQKIRQFFMLWFISLVFLGTWTLLYLEDVADRKES